ncbi:MAG: DUF4445 domain-containing protein [Lachnospiraceae bacterium]|nr:DUF4445 domain-containing protein [Lachnospiraceae bacterium]
MDNQRDNGQRITIEIQKEGTFSLEKGENVLSVLTENNLFDVSHCGGHGTCGKCSVRFLSGAPLPLPADRRRFSPQELRDGWRLACFAKPQQDCAISLPDGYENSQKETMILDQVLFLEKKNTVLPQEIFSETMIVGDLGTTTIVLLLAEKATGRILDTYKTMNPQRKYGADVVSRMEKAMEGESSELSDPVKEILQQAVDKWKKEGYQPERIVLAGNTVMTHLLMNYDVEGLSMAPFVPVTTASVSFDLDGIKVETVPGISGFVGGDILAGMLVCRRLMESDKVSRALFIDLGTNGEMVLISPEGNLCTATAAGPAFEGGFGGRMYGADVIAAVADLLEKGIVDETGLLDERYFATGYKQGQIEICREDIRALQTAKAAVFAGIRILLEEAGISERDVERVYLAGGFGYKLDVKAACDIGLIPTIWKKRTTAVGNTALSGAYLYGLGDRTADMVRTTKSINLAEKEHFNTYYLQAMELREERDFS